MYSTKQHLDQTFMARKRIERSKQKNPKVDIHYNISYFGQLLAICKHGNIGNRTARAVAFVPVMTLLFCRVRAGNDVCSGSKYRFCVPQNRRPCRGAAGHGSGKETAR